MGRATHRHRFRTLVGALLVLQSCGQLPFSADPEPTPAALVSTPTSLPTATMPPTEIPGSAADQEDVAALVQQFGRAVSADQELVALLMLSPSARRVVATSDLSRFLGRAEAPEALAVRDVRLDDDVAFARCVASYTQDEASLQLRLVRLDGSWKIDGRVE